MVSSPFPVRGLHFQQEDAGAWQPHEWTIHSAYDMPDILIDSLRRGQEVGNMAATEELRGRPALHQGILALGLGFLM